MKDCEQSPAAFRTTRWSVVARAAALEHPTAQAALAETCRDYWPPLYAFARRSGHAPADAEDLTQSFFAALIEKNTLATADQSRGRLRAFLLTAFRHHIADVVKHDHAQKRGGADNLLSLDDNGEGGRAPEPIEHETPETLYHRRWAMLLLERALDQLEAERTAAAHGAEMEVLRPFLGFATSGADTYAEAATQLGWTVNAVRVAVFRLRARYRALLLALIAATLHDQTPTVVEAELRDLLAALET